MDRFTELDDRFIRIANGYVRSALFFRKYPCDMPPVSWETFYEASKKRLVELKEEKDGV